MKIVAVLLAGGLGTRLGFNTPKALVSLEGKSILRHSFDRVAQIGLFDQLLVVFPDGHQQEFEDQIGESLLGDTSGVSVNFVRGGEARQESVQAAIRHLSGSSEPTGEQAKVRGQDLIWIHDAARCLVPESVIQRSVSEAQRVGALTTGIPQVASLKRIDPKTEKVTESVDRVHLWEVQTPQVFPFEVLKLAHEKALSTPGCGASATDDASLVERFTSVSVVLGDPVNIKLTSPQDLELARFYLQEGLT